ncbi:MAG: ABC-F family ATP-binding cassette domain-containing protein [Deltaproteobacteria bacterium]|nr:ABC-F family ATP-binding cassette domain-containing protein [Deltaproteobacteria bacterium]
MGILVSVHQLSKTFGARPLFSGITFVLNEGERVGLIGPNGMGKSTLLKILAGQYTPDTGTVSTQKGLRVGYLAQVPTFTPGATVEETVREGVADRDEHDWEAIALVQEFMAKLSLEDGPVDKLSGGWKKRVALARELVRKPDLMLLDEPTNHLDVESILWLEDFLASARFTTLTVTHDRLFLQRIANRILELDRRNAGGLLSVDGDYTTYLETKGALMAAQERREIIMKNTLRRETEWLRRGAKARTTKQQARIKRHGELSEEVGELGYRNQQRTARIDFAGLEKNPKRLIDAKQISKSYGDRKLFKKVDLLITPGTRIGLLGPNGCGKSTLIRCLLGQEAPDTGEVTRSDQVSVAYFEQNRDLLDPSETVENTLCPRGDHVEYRGGRVHIRGYLDRFLFSNEQAVMKVGNLSGGEQSRLLLAKLMLTPANVLVLDEPTNDLDMATLTILEECLVEFPGAVLFVTHDRYFLDQVATKILGFTESGELLGFADIAQWESWKVEQDAAARDAASSQRSAVKAVTAAAAARKSRKLSFNEQRELDGMEATIHKAEARLAELAAESANPDLVSNAIRLNELAKAMATAEAEIERLYSRWTELTE